ncbi:hypothetical protein Trydic_g949 [Trypoxylus dichotomus]
MKIALLTLLPAIALASFSYEGYKVYQITVKNHQQAEILPKLQENANYDFFTKGFALNYPIEVMVGPDAQEEFISTLKTNDIEYNIINENIEIAIKAERERLLRSPKVESGRISFTEFHRFDVIQDYLSQLQVSYPGIVSVEEFGQSLEGRPLLLIRIGVGSPNNPTILIDGTIHAREWISPAVATYIIEQLLGNPDNRGLIENINWVIIPVLNPDGYEYTFTNQRLWRKTRRPGNSCYGVDANRNFAFQWGSNGASSNECSETFMGPYSFSEPEAVALAALAAATPNLIGYLTLHSYGNWILFSWGWTAEPVQNAAELQQLGDAMSDAIYAVNGTRYRPGPTVDLLYYASGTSQDWMTFVGVPLTYTIELTGGVGTGSGFIIQPERILPVSQELWPGLLTYTDYVLQRWRKEHSP